MKNCCLNIQLLGVSIHPATNVVHDCMDIPDIMIQLFLNMAEKQQKRDRRDLNLYRWGVVRFVVPYVLCIADNMNSPKNVGM